MEEGIGMGESGFGDSTTVHTEKVHDEGYDAEKVEAARKVEVAELVSLKDTLRTELGKMTNVNAHKYCQRVLDDLYSQLDRRDYNYRKQAGLLSSDHRI
jgi:hypothetical protein